MVELKPMTRQMCHEFYREFENDPAIYGDMSKFSEFVYTQQWADAYFDRQMEKGRLLFAVYADGQMVGEVKLHSIRREQGECTLGIHLRNDSVKGKGYGTQAERLAAEYAFGELGMHTVHADVIRKNTRSQHVLEKAGFEFVGEDEAYKYYRCEKSKKIAPPEGADKK